ncbi:hypothetical protein U9M48_005960 [Paspalum notatum var. saurae]|uniref:Uncharacterized protein n=1 Tax=Paspalum notatum var. saurae TaxID=547442 RepID=A0AAQ3PYS0_PASNO
MVLTLAVFDNCYLGTATGVVKDQIKRIGKVRIRLSTLEMDKVSTAGLPRTRSSSCTRPTCARTASSAWPCASQITCLSLGSVVYLYGQPLLPKMHYTHPFTMSRHHQGRQRGHGVAKGDDVSLDTGKSKSRVADTVVDTASPSACSRWTAGALRRRPKLHTAAGNSSCPGTTKARSGDRHGRMDIGRDEKGSRAEPEQADVLIAPLPGTRII